MKTAHQFARELLEGPDLPITVPQSKYDDTGAAFDPSVCQTNGEDYDENPVKILIISYQTQP